MKFDYFDISSEKSNIIKGICPQNEYRILTRAQFQRQTNNLLPVALTNKYDSVLIAGSAASNGTVYYMANGNRIDASGNDVAIDQMPFGLMLVGDTTVGSACLIQHGDWENRTTFPPSEEFWGYISASPIDRYFPLSELPTEPEGKISDLKIDSQNTAFRRLISKFREQLGE